MEFLIVASAHFMALLSPGPDFFLILQTTLRLPRPYACALCSGIAAGNAIYIFIAVVGLESVRHMDGLLVLMKYLGGAYLVYIGIALLCSKRRDLEGGENSGFLHVKSMKRQFTIGFLSALLNPKNAIFYLSLFTVMVSGATDLATRIMYGIWMCSVVLVWDILIAFFIGNADLNKKYGNLVVKIERVSGGMLAFFGVILSLS